MPLIRDAGPGDIRAVLGVYSACITADAGYLPFLKAGDEPTVLAWFLLKPPLACLVAEQDGLVAGVAGCGTPNRAPERGRPPDAGWKRAAWPSIPRTAGARSPGT